MNIICEFNGPIDSVIDGELAENVFAVLRELLTNAIKHSKAHLVEVQVSALKTKCEVRIVDDGVGIEVDVHRSGLLNLSKRAEDFGGTFEIYKRPNGGTRAIWTGKL